MAVFRESEKFKIMAPQIKMYKARHRGENRLFISFEYDKELISLVKKVQGATWSASKKVWHTEFSIKNIQATKELLEPHAELNYSEINADLSWMQQQEKKGLGLLTAAQADKYRDDFRVYLRHLRYSNSTLKTYGNALKQFLLLVGKPPAEVTNEDLVAFNNYLADKKYSFSLQNQVISALKTYFRKLHNRKLEIEKIERPRREYKLPNVLSKEEVKKILDAPANIKHRAMLSLIYACGLRRSELLNLKPGDIDSKRGLITIRNAKGRKDRVVPISEKIIELLRTYFKGYRPKVYLFEGQEEASRYSEESLSKVLKNAVKNVKINRPVTLHWLRHSYATHMLESGVDLRYIQELLGHKSSKTTEIYTHVSIKSLQKIKSPFDDL